MRRVPVILLALAAALLAVAAAEASSHREAPGITKMPKVDGSDFYMFNSYEAGRQGFVTLIANYLPLQDAYGGPNFFALDPEAVYRIHIDNDGDGVEDITFQFKFGENFRDIQLPVGGKNVSVPLINVGQIANNGSPGLNRAESYTVTVITGPVDGAGQGAGQNLRNAVSGGARFGKPVDNIGEKSIPDYPNYAKQFIYEVNIPGCGTSTGRVFVGQRHDGFAVNLGEIFDLVNISNPLGPRDAEPNTLADKNVTTIALEVPASCLTKGSNPTIGAWTTAALPRTSVLVDAPEFASTATVSGGFVQVSRLGAPLVNEVVIGLKDKNKFNNSTPNHDGQFADYVTNPTLPAILEILFGGAGVRAPTNFPRTDLVAAFLTGVTGLNQLGGPAEELRLNTSIAATAPGSQNNLGVLGGDNAGFPNGRRPGDDVVDIELRVAMGVLCHAFPGVYCTPAQAPSGNLPFTDGTLQDVSQFDNSFPYLKPPIPGSPNGPNGLHL
ncbi:MAG TPA: DUF4331 domain-containing protein [Thermoanaerobaculia bacterium]|nr:DUF4331 domain-containing protein [Thermoanaerobaculia bacterium]